MSETNLTKTVERKPELRTVEIFKYDQLSDESKETARDWYRDGALDYDWWDCTYEDAATIGLTITGFDLDRSRHATGEFKFFGGAEQCAGLILQEHGEDCETFKTASTFLSDLKKLNAEIEAVDGDDETNAEWEVWQDKRGELSDEFLRSLLEDYSIMLQNEYEYLLSDESVEETIMANEYDFSAEGKRTVAL